MLLLATCRGLDLSMDAAHLIAPYRGEGHSPYSAEQRDMVLQLVSESNGEQCWCGMTCYKSVHAAMPLDSD